MRHGRRCRLWLALAVQQVHESFGNDPLNILASAHGFMREFGLLDFEFDCGLVHVHFGLGDLMLGHLRARHLLGVWLLRLALLRSWLARLARHARLRLPGACGRPPRRRCGR